jgi:glutaredoxin
MNKLLVFCLLVASLSVQAQAYRWVDPATGRTIISDSPPPPNAKSVNKTKDPTTNTEGRSFATLKAAEAFPVTLYSTADCINECKQARELLNKRGVPFSEKMLQKPEDYEEVKKLVGDAFIPSLKVGRQSVRGFEATSYNNLLDLAGYPTSAPVGSKPSGGLSK